MSDRAVCCNSCFWLPITARVAQLPRKAGDCREFSFGTLGSLRRLFAETADLSLHPNPAELHLRAVLHKTGCSTAPLLRRERSWRPTAVACVDRVQECCQTLWIAAASRPAYAKGVSMPSNVAAWDEQAFLVSDREPTSMVGLKQKFQPC